MAAQYGVGQSVAVPVSAVDMSGASAGLAHRTRLCVCVQQDSRTLFVVTIRLRNNIKRFSACAACARAGLSGGSLTGVRSHLSGAIVADCVASGRRAPRTVPAQNRRQNG
jgi:hypothetical protein